MRVPSGRIDNPAFALVLATISFTGVTSAAGASSGLTIVDSTCGTSAQQPSYAGHMVKLASSDAAGQMRTIVSHDLSTGTLDVDSPFTDYNGAAYQVPAGTLFYILVSVPGAGPVTETTGTISYDETVATEQTVLTLTIATRTHIGSIWFDLVNLTQNNTINYYHQVDGTNYRNFYSFSYVAGSTSDAVLFQPFTAYRNVQITMTCGGGGAGSVDVPYAIV